MLFRGLRFDCEAVLMQSYVVWLHEANLSLSVVFFTCDPEMVRVISVSIRIRSNDAFVNCARTSG